MGSLSQPLLDLRGVYVLQVLGGGASGAAGLSVQWCLQTSLLSPLLSVTGGGAQPPKVAELPGVPLITSSLPLGLMHICLYSLSQPL